METKYIKSPLNYTGGKYKLLNQIIPLFPEKINGFYDLFCGGCNVGINVNSEWVLFNDIMPQIIELYNTWKKMGYDEVKKHITSRINEFSLSKINQEGYNALRTLYNKERNILDLFVLVAYSFNHQIRFNSKGDFNMPFGKDRSEFNPTMDKNLKAFIDKLQNTECRFESCGFADKGLILSENDFVYADPPYLITTASYNENGGWGEVEERKLLELLDKLHEKNVKFALSNVLENKGKENTILKEWSKKYNVHHLNMTYSNCSYHALDKSTNTTDEVLITNY